MEHSNHVAAALDRLLAGVRLRALGGVIEPPFFVDKAVRRRVGGHRLGEIRLSGRELRVLPPRVPSKRLLRKALARSARNEMGVIGKSPPLTRPALELRPSSEGTRARGRGRIAFLH